MASLESYHVDTYTSNLPSPPASSMSFSQHPSPLPQSRRHPLKPGGQKESELIRYLDQGVNRIQKRVDNRLTNRKVELALGESVGYATFWEVAKDLEGLVDVVWVSGSPNLQVPYLLNIAVLTVEFLPLFVGSPRSADATFRLLTKLDFAFSSLLTGHDSTTGEFLPGFELGWRVSTTNKVRLKGVVDRTRLTVVRVLGGDSVIDGDEDGDGDESTTSDIERKGRIPAGGREDTVTFEGFENNEVDEEEDDDDDDGCEERSIASVYEKTIEELGDVLGGPPIGIITDDWAATKIEQPKGGLGFVEDDFEVEP